jgi:Immunity protein 49
MNQDYKFKKLLTYKQGFNTLFQRIMADIDVDAFEFYSLASTCSLIVSAEVGLNQDFINSRRLSYLSAISFLKYLEQAKKQKITSHMNLEFFFQSILSDSDEIIEKIKDYELCGFREDERWPNFCIFRCFQSVLNNDFEQLKIFEDQLFVSMKKHKKIWKDYLFFFETLRTKDEQGCQKILTKMLQLPHDRCGENIYKEMFSPEITALIKLAKFHGLTIQIDSQRVPTEMVAIQPLDIYTSFEDAGSLFPEVGVWINKIINHQESENQKEKKTWFSKVIDKISGK